MPEPVDLLTPAMDSVVRRAELRQAELGRELTDAEFAAVLDAVAEEFETGDEDSDTWFDSPI